MCRKAATPFLDWLRTAEDEESSSSDDDDSDDDEEVITQKKPVKPTGGKVVGASREGSSGGLLLRLKWLRRRMMGRTLTSMRYNKHYTFPTIALVVLLSCNCWRYFPLHVSVLSPLYPISLVGSGNSSVKVVV